MAVERKRSHVTQLAKKHRYIMYIMLNVAKRSEGMGLKLMKFHAIIHMVEDILLFDVPSEFDTGSNKSVSKTSKTHGIGSDSMPQMTGEFMEPAHLRCYMPYCWVYSSISGTSSSCTLGKSQS